MSKDWNSMSSQEKVEWLAVEGFPCYEVSNRGDIRSTKRYKEPRILSKNVSGTGYYYIHMRKDGKTYNKKVSRIVCKAFMPHVDPTRSYVNHIDGNKHNDCVENLEWCTQGENIEHAYRTGLRKSIKGEESPHSKLTEANVRHIRSMHKNGGYSTRQIARTFNISHTTVRKICNFTDWKHIKDNAVNSITPKDDE